MGDEGEKCQGPGSNNKGCNNKLKRGDKGNLCPKCRAREENEITVELINRGDD